VFQNTNNHKDSKMDQVKLESMKYKELQKLAKKVGIKANLPKAELVVALLEKDENNLDESLVPLEESKLDTTFEIVNESEQNVLNETFEKDSMSSLENEGDTISSSDPKGEKADNQDTTLETLDESNDGSRFVEFMSNEEEEEVNFKTRRRTRSLEKVNTPANLNRKSILSSKSVGKSKLTPSSSRKSISSRKSVGGTRPSSEYLSNKNKTPLRTTIKTPGSIQKKTESQIPRFVQYANKVKSGKIPDFAKMHEKNFKKMESLDSYLEKKRKITDSIRKQLEKTSSVSNQSNSNTLKKVDENNANFVPAVTSTAKMNLNFGKSKENSDQPAFQFGTSNSAVPFKFTAKPVAAAPKVIPKQRQDLKAHTKKKVDIPSKTIRKSFSNPTPSKPFLNITNNANKSVNKSLTGTPNKKFDLAASLAKPLNYKPHTGKIKPLEKKKKEVFSVKDSFSHEETKQRQMAVIKGVRMNKRAELLMNRRKISAD